MFFLKIKIWQEPNTSHLLQNFNWSNREMKIILTVLVFIIEFGFLIN